MAEPPAARVQLVVTYQDHQVMYYPVRESWRVAAAQRCLVVGRFPRLYIPLDSVLSFVVEPLPDTTVDSHSSPSASRASNR